MKIKSIEKFLIVQLMLLVFLVSSLFAEDYSILFSGTVQGETEPCG